MRYTALVLLLISSCSFGQITSVREQNGTFQYKIGNGWGSVIMPKDTARFADKVLTNITLSTHTSQIASNSTAITAQAGRLTDSITVHRQAINTLQATKQNALTNPVTGTGTAGYTTRWILGTTVGVGALRDDGIHVGINDNGTLYYPLQIKGANNSNSGLFVYESNSAIQALLTSSRGSTGYPTVGTLSNHAFDIMANGAMVARFYPGGGVSVAGSLTANSVDLNASIAANAATASAHIANTNNPHAVTAAQVGAYTTGQVDTKVANKPDDIEVASFAAAKAAITPGTKQNFTILNNELFGAPTHSKYNGANWSHSPALLQNN